MDSPDNVMRFANTAIVLKQPLLVAITTVFIVGLLASQYNPGGSSAPASVWAWLLRLALLAIVALGVWMLCHSEEVIVDANRQQVTQSHRLLHYEVTKNLFRFSDFSGVAVVLKIESEQTGSATPTGAATVTSARTVRTRSYSLNLRRPDIVLSTPERQISAPNYPLELPMAESSNPLEVEAEARKLARLGGWPAWRQHYAVETGGTSAGTRSAYTVKVVPGADDPIRND